MLNIDGINIYTTKTMITCNEDLAGQIYVGKEESEIDWTLRDVGSVA